MNLTFISLHGNFAFVVTLALHESPCRNMILAISFQLRNNVVKQMTFQTWFADATRVWIVENASAVWSRLLPNGTDAWSFIFGLGWGFAIVVIGGLGLGMYLVETDPHPTWNSNSWRHNSWWTEDDASFSKAEKGPDDSEVDWWSKNDDEDVLRGRQGW